MTHETSVTFDGSMAYMERAKVLIPRGTTSARRERKPTPLVFRSARGSRLIDVDRNEYVDYVAGMGPMLLGHQHEAVAESVDRAVASGVLFGGQHEGELELAERLVRLVPSADMALLCSTGSEAAAVAIRVARAATGRSTILKFEGHYHGWLEPLAVNLPGMDAAPDGRPAVASEAGLPTPAHVRVCPWNDYSALEAALAGPRNEVAAVVMEPIACNAGNLHADPGYLAAVRNLCDRLGILLIFDEVITGFRLGLAGAQGALGITPDITILGKAIASGYPLAAVVGRAEVMAVATSTLAHLGTYNGNVPAVSAANATLGILESQGGDIYPRLEHLAERLADGLVAIADDTAAPLAVLRAGSILRLVWGGPRPIRSYADIRATNRTALEALAAELQVRGVHVLGRGLWYVSAAHTEEDIDVTLAAARIALASAAARAPDWGEP
jgi:glutamate-1-semialdehyde 2,1-aminomutase